MRSSRHRRAVSIGLIAARKRCHHRVSQGRAPLSQTESAKDFWTLPSLNEPGSTTQATSPRRAIRRGQASGLLLVVHVSDNVGDVLVAFLLLLDEGGVVQARVLEFYLFLGFFLGFLG